MARIYLSSTYSDLQEHREKIYRVLRQLHGRVPALDLAGYFRRLEQQYARLDLNALTPPQREEYLQILLRSVFVEQNVRAEPPPVELPKMTWELLRSRGELRGDDRSADLSLAELYRQRDVYQRKPARPALGPNPRSRP